MIDLDRAQDECGWDARLRVGGVVVMLAHPGTQSATNAGRSGLVPLLWRGVVRCWRVLAGSTQTEDLRREVLSCVAAGDAEGRHAVMGMGAWDLARVYAAYQEAAKRLLVQTAAYAAGGGTAANQQSGKAQSGKSEGDERPLNGDSTALTLTAGGGRLPGVMNGGPLWGAAWVKANPGEAAKRLRERAQRDIDAAKQLDLAEAARMEQEQAEHTEVTHGG